MLTMRKGEFKGITWKKLRIKIKKDHNIILPKFAYRLYGGWSDRLRGSWSWGTHFPNGVEYGSTFSVGKLLKAHCIDVSEEDEFTQISLDPCNHEKEKNND